MKVLKYFQNMIFFFGTVLQIVIFFRQSELKLHFVEGTSNFHSAPRTLGKELGFL